MILTKKQFNINKLHQIKQLFSDFEQVLANNGTVSTSKFCKIVFRFCYNLEKREIKMFVSKYALKKVFYITGFP